ncbi:MAG: tRNA pseudouridine(38-40) synthase TruA [Dehalococcoidales bacterium]|nr:tRNA pseudouridine(38-40) synthase TruA [Dehalococcoidales bacterium]
MMAENISPVDNTIRRLVLIVEYNGSEYYGFQLQAKLPTVQGELEKAIYSLTGEKIRVASASRTDTGVHARGQVVSFKAKSAIELGKFISGLNYYLPADIAVKAAYRVENSFNVRSKAVSREYKYYILNSYARSPMWEDYSYRVSGELDIEAMNKVARELVGEHDFASFTSNLGVELKSTIRRIYNTWFDRDGEMVVFNVVASSFLPHQARNTVGALIRVGQGKVTGEEFHSIMDAKKLGLAGPAAPAKGLCLMKVNYKKSLEEENSEYI